MLGKLGLKECLGVQDECVKVAVLDLAESTGDFRPAVKRLSGEVILRLAYGYKPTGLNDRFVNLSQDSLYVFLDTITPDWLVNVFPIFRHVPAWVPFQGWRTTAREGRKLVEAANSEPFEWAREQLSKGSAEPSSFTARFLPQVQDDPEELRMLQHSVNNLYAAGFDTTQAAGQWLLVLLALHPEVQSRAQAEIDGVTGGGERLPTYEDREAGKTPYLDAVVKEVWRWAAFVPLALPHATAREDYYKGYVIPKGAIVLPSTWRIMHNPQKYPEPDKFNPDRFLGKSQQHDSDTRSMVPEMVNENPMNYLFGYGPRQCPGRFFVDATTWLFAAHVLSTLDLSEPMDLSGQRLTKETVTFLPGVVGYPNSNGVQVRVRSQRALAMLNEAVDR